MTPDYDRAAAHVAVTLIENHISAAPVDPLPILKRTPGVLVLTFQEMSENANIPRKEILDMFGCANQDAVTTVYLDGSSPRYVVSYNKMLSSRIVDRALARELGHIVLGHDGSRPEGVRNEEAVCFAHHLLVPRALIHAIQATGLRLTTEVFGNITGCYDHCLSCMRRQPGAHVDPALNRAVRENFRDYIMNFFEFQRHAGISDGSALADLGSYMEGYEE